MRKILMIGQFPPPITGEGVVNLKVKDVLFNNGHMVEVIDSSLISNASDVGSFRFIKLFKLLKIYFVFLLRVFGCSVVYITPGQTFFGVLRTFPIIVFSTMLNKKVILHWHGYGLLCFLKKYSSLGFFIFNSRVVNILLTEDIKMKISSYGMDVTRSYVLKNYHDYSDYPSVINERTKLKVLYLGSLMPEKGVLEFIQASKQLPELEFIVCGDGDAEIRSELIRISNELDNLSYEGVVSGDDKISVLKDADVFVLQSSYATEGVPLSVLEAMAFSNALIVTKHNGIPEVVPDNAIFVEKSSIKDLVKNLSILSRDRSLLKEIQLGSFNRSKLYTESEFSEKLILFFK